MLGSYQALGWGLVVEEEELGKFKEYIFQKIDVIIV